MRESIYRDSRRYGGTEKLDWLTRLNVVRAPEDHLLGGREFTYKYVVDWATNRPDINKLGK